MKDSTRQNLVCWKNSFLCLTRSPDNLKFLRYVKNFDYSSSSNSLSPVITDLTYSMKISTWSFRFSFQKDLSGSSFIAFPALKSWKSEVAKVCMYFTFFSTFFVTRSVISSSMAESKTLDSSEKWWLKRPVLVVVIA